MSSGFEVIYTFAEGGGAAVARLAAESFEEAAAFAVLQVPGRSVKRIELTDLSYEDANEARWYERQQSGSVYVGLCGKPDCGPDCGVCA